MTGDGPSRRRLAGEGRQHVAERSLHGLAPDDGADGEDRLFSDGVADAGQAQNRIDGDVRIRRADHDHVTRFDGRHDFGRRGRAALEPHALHRRRAMLHEPLLKGRSRESPLDHRGHG
jgi:hypothetical protein